MIVPAKQPNDLRMLTSQAEPGQSEGWSALRNGGQSYPLVFIAGMPELSLVEMALVTVQGPSVNITAREFAA
jgi:hypothetical protein